MGLNAECDASSNTTSACMHAYWKIAGLQLCSSWYASLQCSSVRSKAIAVAPEPSSMVGRVSTTQLPLEVCTNCEIKFHLFGVLGGKWFTAWITLATSTKLILNLLDIVGKNRMNERPWQPNAKQRRTPKNIHSRRVNAGINIIG